MPNIRSLARSFTGGELTSEFFGQVTDGKFQTGLALCRNFIVLPHGPIQNRAGFEFVRAAKFADKRVRVIPFTFSTTQTMTLELGVGYVRFHTNGATLLNVDGTPYEVATPYAEADLFDIHYVQSADVLTLVHPGYAPRELRRMGALSWSLSTIAFATPLAPPTSLTAVATAGTPTPGATPGPNIDHVYAVTTVDDVGLNESVISQTVTCSNNLLVNDAFNTIRWSPAAGGRRYNVYKRSNGLWGFLGQADGTEFKDDNITPDVGNTAPEQSDPFTAGQISAVPVINGGAGYGSAQTGGAITFVSVLNGGNGYVSPVVTVSDPSGGGAAFTANLGPSGSILSVTVNAQGVNYTSPTFIVSDAGGGEGAPGSGASLSAVVTPIVRGGVALAVTDAGGGTGASVAPLIVDGVITGVSIVSPGRGYVSPVVTVTSAGGGAGAVFGMPTISVGDFPGAVSYYEQRRVFGGTLNKPQNLWFTRSGTESNMSSSLPSKDTDSISFRVVAREANTVRHLVPLNNLVALTSSAEWRIGPPGGVEALTPSNTPVKPQSYIGANNVQPQVVNNNLIYAAARGGHVRELAYSNDAGGYLTGDLSLRAPHLFDELDIVDMAQVKAPQPVVWVVSSDGRLLGLTYVPEQKVGAWHQHATDGAFESIAVVAEDRYDALYAVVRRVIGGQTVRYIERQRRRAFIDPKDAFFVDSGLTYSGAPVSSFSGLGHLEGKTVAILADGAVFPQQIVNGGAVALEQPASKVHVGLPLVSEAQTLPLAMEMQAFGQGRAKNVNKVFLRVNESGAISAGPSFDKLVEAKQRTNEPYGSAPRLQTREVEIVVQPSWDDSAQICIQQVDPLPLTILSMTLDVAVGG